MAGTRRYVLAVIEHAHRLVRILGIIPHSTATWVTQPPATSSWTYSTLAVRLSGWCVGLWPPEKARWLNMPMMPGPSVVPVSWLGLTVLVAVRLDAEVLLASVGQDLSRRGQEQLRRGTVSDLEAEDGGASAVLADPDRGHREVWVGVVNGALTGECDCAEGVSDGLCRHAIAVALAALQQGLTFSSIQSRVLHIDPDHGDARDVGHHRKSPAGELDDLIAEVLVDCYDDAECMMAFCTVLGDEIPLPCDTVFLGMPVEVIAIGASRAPGVIATCRRGDAIGEVDVTSLTFPDGSVAAWLQAAYLRYLGHDPGCPSPPSGWHLRSWDQQ